MRGRGLEARLIVTVNSRGFPPLTCDVLELDGVQQREELLEVLQPSQLHLVVHGLGLVHQDATQRAELQVRLEGLPVREKRGGRRKGAGTKIALLPASVCVCVCVCVCSSTIITYAKLCHSVTYATTATSTVEVCRLNRPRYVKLD